MGKFCSLGKNIPVPSRQTSVAQNSRAPTETAETRSIQPTAQSKGKAPMTLSKQSQHLYEMERSDN